MRKTIRVADRKRIPGDDGALLRLMKYLKPFMPLVCLAILLVFVQVLAELGLPTLMAEIVDKGIARGDTAFIVRTGGRMLLLALAGSVAAVGGAYTSSRAAMGFGRELRQKVFSHIESFSLEEFDRFGTASLITRTTNDVMQIQMAVLMAMRMFAMSPLMLAGGIIMAVSRQPRLSLTLVLALPVLAVVALIPARTGMSLFRSIQTKLDRLNRVLREHLTGVRVIRAFNRTEWELRRFDDANRDLTQTSVRVNRIMAVLQPGMSLTVNMTTIAIIWVGARYIDAGFMEVGELMAFIQYAMHILISLMLVSMVFVMLPRASASADRILEVLDTVPTVPDPDLAHDDIREAKGDLGRQDVSPAGELAATSAGAETPRVTWGKVEFREVTFRYPGAEQPAVRNVTFEARPGQLTAIIGGTGSGKSTLVSLIMRFYDVESGQVLVDEVDVRQYRPRDLRAGIGFVPQKTILFTGTVAENIRYGKPDASDDELKEAAQAAQAYGFINELEDGFGSFVAEGGTNFSGGQKQRLAIARVLVRKPRIYLFDDSFSALDFKTDAMLRKVLKQRARDATVIVVTQRVSMAMAADQIIVMDQGTVVGIGTHSELLRTCPVYREIAASQLSEEELTVS